MLESGDITVFYLPSCYFVISISVKKVLIYYYAYIFISVEESDTF